MASSNARIVRRSFIGGSDARIGDGVGQRPSRLLAPSEPNSPPPSRREIHPERKLFAWAMFAGSCCREANSRPFAIRELDSGGLKCLL
jgi:hypothetical protein